LTSHVPFSASSPPSSSTSLASSAAETSESSAGVRPRPSPGTSLAPSARTLWRSSRGVLAAFVALLLFAIFYSVINSSDQYGPLDPRSPRPDGSRAIAHLLTAEGVTVRRSTTTARTTALTKTGDSTVLVTSPQLLDANQLSALRSTGANRIVLIGPIGDALAALAPGVTPAIPDPTAAQAAADPVSTRQPDCPLPAARRAGSVQLGGIAYLAPPPGGTADACYSLANSYALLRVDRTGGDTVVLGSASFLENNLLDQQGDASLALQLLGAHRNLIWYQPELGDGAATSGTQQQTSPLDLLPPGWRWGLLQAGIAALLAALWRARRLGPIVAERLLVVVRASETTEGRARLYRKGRARAQAAQALRQAARVRLAALVGCRANAPAETFCATVIDRMATGPGAPDRNTTGSAHPGPAHSLLDIHSLLFGPPPTDDAALVRLADQLDALERQVHHP
jgi:hypothetical protein